MEDIRLSDEVNELRQKNYELANEKLDRVGGMIGAILEAEFGGEYDESCIYSVYVRKGNDMNSCAGTYMQGSTIITSLDSMSFKSFVAGIGKGIEDV